MARSLKEWSLPSPSKDGCWLEVINRTSRDVCIIWLDKNGKEKVYVIVKPGKMRSLHSFEGHPWLCRDASTKRRLLMNNKELFITAPPDIPEHLMRRTWTFPVVQAYVTLPIFTLQDISADTISKCVSSEKDIQTLELPAKMKDFVVNCYQNVNSKMVPSNR